MWVYCVTAVDWEGHPVAAWVLAPDPDEATSKAIPQLPPGGRISHLFKLCRADLATFNRNKLDQLLSIPDRIDFTAATVFELLEAQGLIIDQLQTLVEQLQIAAAKYKDN